MEQSVSYRSLCVPPFYGYQGSFGIDSPVPVGVRISRGHARPRLRVEVGTVVLEGVLDRVELESKGGPVGVVLRVWTTDHRPWVIRAPDLTVSAAHGVHNSYYTLRGVLDRPAPGMTYREGMERFVAELRLAGLTSPGDPIPPKPPKKTQVNPLTLAWLRDLCKGSDGPATPVRWDQEGKLRDT